MDGLTSRVGCLVFVWGAAHELLGILPILPILPNSDPGKQFDLVAHHIQTIRRLPGFDASRFMIYVERNLGFEAGEQCSRVTSLHLARSSAY